VVKVIFYLVVIAFVVGIIAFFVYLILVAAGIWK